MINFETTNATTIVMYMLENKKTLMLEWMAIAERYVDYYEKEKEF